MGHHGVGYSKVGDTITLPVILVGGEAYQYMDDLLALNACRPQARTPFPDGLRQLWTPLQWEVWDHAEKTPGPEVQTVHCRWLEVWVPCRQHDERNEQREQTTEEHAVIPGAARGSGRVPCGRVR